jgi:hypothetical protein
MYPVPWWLTLAAIGSKMPFVMTRSTKTNDLMKLIFFIALLGAGLGFRAAAQEPAAGQIRGSESVLPVASEPPPKLIVDPPLPGPLAQGKVIIGYRTENLRIVPVFGEPTRQVSPRIGHLHVSVDDSPWVWAHASNDQPLIIVGLPPGPHQVRVQIADPNHKILQSEVVSFQIPGTKEPSTSRH